jgi:beta-1,2-mannobiose phosphorylase / 1,2-beta-oligomannan phosphorylase
MFVLKRFQHNPCLVPDRTHHWEASATFNMSPIKKGDTVYGFYRAMSAPDKLRAPAELSTIGVAKRVDGGVFEDRQIFIEPEKDWEVFGCEDPRVTFFEGKYYIFYTALSTFPFSAEGIKVAVAISSDLEKVEERHLVTPFNAKAMTLFPERVNGKVTAIFSANTDKPPSKTVVVQADNIEDLWSPEFWEKWLLEIDNHVIDPRRLESEHIEVGATPIKTDKGWLFIYSHIENYFHSEEGKPPRFGIEALLLDLNDPRIIIGATHGPMMVPEEPYEFHGQVPNVIFPSGALLEGDVLNIYYGAADTTVCMARVNMEDLISTLHPDTRERWQFKRYEGNPIMEPLASNPWEAQAVFNPAAIEIDGKIYILYRALSEDNTSTIGLAVSEDGLTLTERLPDPIYVPREDFEMKKIDRGNSGCEDPRITKIGDTLYMCYTAFDSIGPPRVALTSIKESDFVARNWNWKKPVLITPPGVDDKDTCLLPEKIGEEYLVLHRIGTDICGDFLDSLDFDKETVTKCIRVMGPRSGMWDGLKIGIAGPPVKTEHGWLLLYHAVSEIHHRYRIGAVLLDVSDPTIVLSRSTDVIFQPETKYEIEGVVNNVVFPCGMVVRDNLIYSYYGGADKVTGVATMELDVIIRALVRAIPYSD